MLNKQLKSQIEQEAEYNTRDFKDNNEYQTGYIQGYKDGYEIGGVKYAEPLQAAEERAEVTTEKIIDLMDFVSEAKGQISDEEIISQVRKSLPGLLEALTPKTSDDE